MTTCSLFVINQFRLWKCRHRGPDEGCIENRSAGRCFTRLVGLPQAGLGWLRVGQGHVPAKPGKRFERGG